ncbi:MAG: hypothetical protein AMJ93_16985 [Anaerolineae bacterium SM23_84]|nr:MAG: hypothetical protein AMJ93_16985 [Anaerolineae bacterium SM23_84]
MSAGAVLTVEGFCAWPAFFLGVGFPFADLGCRVAFFVLGLVVVPFVLPLASGLAVPFASEASLSFLSVACSLPCLEDGGTVAGDSGFLLAVSFVFLRVVFFSFIPLPFILRFSSILQSTA